MIFKIFESKLAGQLTILKMTKFSIYPNRLFLIIMLSFFIFSGYAQKIVRVEGSAIVKMENNKTKNETYQKAEQLAKIKAIENKFGTYVEQQTDITINNGKTAYNIIGQTKVKGEWIETTYKKCHEDIRHEKGDYGQQNVIYVTCDIKGKARELRPKANLDIEVLNLPNIKSRTTSFYDNDQLYIYFKSPVDGYLTIYQDDADNNVYRLIPDIYTPSEFESGIFIKGDTDNILFSPQQNKLPQKEVQQYEMFTNKLIEYDNIYVIFSEEKFVKPALKGIQVTKERKLPKSLSSSDFQQWLSENRAAIPSFQIKKIKISIQPEKN